MWRLCNTPPPAARLRGNTAVANPPRRMGNAAFLPDKIPAIRQMHPAPFLNRTRVNRRRFIT